MEGEGANSKRWREKLLFGHFPQKLHANEGNWTSRGPRIRQWECFFQILSALKYFSHSKWNGFTFTLFCSGGTCNLHIQRLETLKVEAEAESVLTMDLVFSGRAATGGGGRISSSGVGGGVDCFICYI